MGFELRVVWTGPDLPLLIELSVSTSDRHRRQRGRMLIVPNRGEGGFLDPLPLGVLPVPPAEMLKRLYLFAITNWAASPNHRTRR